MTRALLDFDKLSLGFIRQLETDALPARVLIELGLENIDCQQGVQIDHVLSLVVELLPP